MPDVICATLEPRCSTISGLPKRLKAAMLAAASPFRSAADLDEAPSVLPSGNSAIVVKYGRVVVKAHRSETEALDLNARLRLIRHATLRDLFVQPLHHNAERGDSRLLTLWPAGTAPVLETPDDVDWESGAALLAALHRSPFPNVFSHSLVPKAGWPSRLMRSRSRLRMTANRPEKRIVLAAFATLPRFEAKAWLPGGPRLVHGDWHPGQVVLMQGSPRLIDIDDLGWGSPAWDLARPAAWYIAGFLPSPAWSRFLATYHEAGGPAACGGNPWTTLELPARAAAIQDAAKALCRAEREARPLEDYERELVRLCSRIVSQCA